ncbi:MAG: hypothetical protein JSV79_05720 [Armatimonadota bacterium]|nr:MAG: hypothetical protein JSV79_05720 [Armatimonadota bacterium]
MSFVGLRAAGITLTISTCLNVWQRSVEAAELNQEARAVMELLSRDIGGTYLGLERMTGYLVGSSAAEGESPVDALVVCTESSISRAALVPQELQATWSPERHPPVTDYVVASYQWLPAEEQAPEGLYRTIRLAPAGYAEPTSEWGAGSDWGSGSDWELGSDREFGEMAPELISDAVVGLTFRYYDGHQWVDSWETTEDDPRLPWGLSIELVLRDARESDHVYQTIVPIRTR